MTYSTHVIYPHVDIRKTMEMKTLTRLHVSGTCHKKKQLYITNARSQLLYLIITLNNISKTTQKKITKNKKTKH